MRNLTAAFRRALGEGRRDYTVRVVITLADSTVLNGTTTTYDEDTGEKIVTTVPYLTNENIWTDGLEIDDATSADNVFQIGTAIINQCKVVINNIYDTYSTYDFTGAVVVPYVGMKNLDDGTSDEVKLGTFNVDEASYDNGLVTLTCLDNMVKFDKAYEPYSMTATSLNVLVNAACTACGVTAGPSAIDFPNKTHQVRDSVVSDATTYRQVISWIAQLAGCNARCDANGYLTFGFYNFDGLEEAQDNLDGGIFDNASPYASGDTADGGIFNPWNTGYVYDAGGFVGGYGSGVHLIASDYSSRVMVDDVVITGIRVAEKVLPDFLSSYANAYSSSSTYLKGAYAYYDNTLYQCVSAIASPEEFNRDHWTSVSVMTYTAGVTGYVIGIENNDLIQAGYGQTFANTLNSALSGRIFRPCNITHPSNPAIEAGDVALYWDHKQNRHPIIISSTKFSIGASQNTVSSAETPARNSAQRFSEATANYVELRKQMERQKDYLAERLANASGLYETYTTDAQTGSGQIYHYHDKPLLSDSNIVMKFTTAGFTLTADYQTPASQGGPTWYGMTVDGQLIAEILSVSGINADWINTGHLSANYLYGGTVQGSNVVVGGLNNENGLFQVKDTSGTSVVAGDSSGMYAQNGGIIQTVSTYHKTQLTDGLLRFLTSSPVTGKPWLGERLVGEIGFDDVDGLSDPNDFRFYIEQAGDMVFDANYGTSHTVFNLQVECMEGIQVNNGLFADNVTSAQIKARCIKDTNYGDILTYCYETPTPMFGDIGFGVIGPDGTCLISIDDIFDETINTDNEYAVFIQKEGSGDAWVSEKDHTYFVVSGTPNLKFAWEIKVVQRGYETLRLDDVDMLLKTKIDDDGFLERDFDNELAEYDRETEEIFG